MLFKYAVAVFISQLVLVLPCPAAPSLALPDYARTGPARPGPIWPSLAPFSSGELPLPCLAEPCHAAPGPAAPGQAQPGHAVPRSRFILVIQRLAFGCALTTEVGSRRFTARPKCAPATFAVTRIVGEFYRLPADITRHGFREHCYSRASVASGSGCEASAGPRSVGSSASFACACWQATRISLSFRVMRCAVPFSSGRPFSQ